MKCDLCAAFFIAVGFQNVNQPFELYNFDSSLSVASSSFSRLLQSRLQAPHSIVVMMMIIIRHRSLNCYYYYCYYLSSALFVIIIISSYHLTGLHLTVDLGYCPPAVALVAVSSPVVVGGSDSTMTCVPSDAV
jgi:hypothetical protein